MSLQIFSARLIDLMQFNNLSKHKLADETGAQRKSVINWVEGRNYPRPNMLIKLANYFRVSTDYLVGSSDTNGRGDYVCKLEYEEIQPRLIAILEDYMKCKHLTKYALSKMFGMEQSTLERWFKKGAMPEIFVLIRISERMNKSLDYLLGRE